MVRFPKVSRLAVAALLTVAAVGFTSGVSSAQVEPTGSLVDNGDGTATLNYDPGAGAPWALAILPSGIACPTGTVSFVDVVSVAQYAANEEVLGAVPVLIEEGVTVGEIATEAEVPLPAGAYELCLYYIGGGGVALVYLSSLAVDIGDEPEPTTTTTVAPTTTTTVAPAPTPVPVPRPATPRFTG